MLWMSENQVNGKYVTFGKVKNDSKIKNIPFQRKIIKILLARKKIINLLLVMLNKLITYTSEC